MSKKFEIPIFTREDLDIIPKEEVELYGHYTLSNNVIDEMVKKIDKSIQIKKELWFDLCIDSDKINARNDCEGEAFCINGKRECPSGERLIGSFHTHPFTDTTDPSENDMVNACILGIECIGARKEIKCYKRILGLDRYKECYSQDNKIYEDFREVDMKRDNLIKKRKKLTIENFEKVKPGKVK